jgi:hypothetical protein
MHTRHLTSDTPQQGPQLYRWRPGSTKQPAHLGRTCFTLVNAHEKGRKILARMTP